MAQGIQLVPLPAQGTVAGRPRKESIYDTECWPGAAAIANLTTFQNFSSFSNAPTTSGLTKQFGRDTNLRGAGNSGLPQATHFFWYAWRCKIRALGSNLGTAPNVVVFEQINRARELSYASFAFQTSTLITLQLDELPSGTGPQYANTTHTTATILSLPNGVPDRRTGKDVTVMGRPVELNALEAFTVPVFVPQAAGLAPTVDLFVTPVLDGLLLRGLSA